MPQPSHPSVRPPARAGMFYPADPAECRAQASGFLHEVPRPEKPWIGGVVPHAGWVFSGAIAGQTISALAACGPVDVVVIFGAIHTPYRVQSGVLDSHQQWAMPVGGFDLPWGLHERLLNKGNVFMVDARLHDMEHAIEVEIPLVRLAFPRAAIVPVEVPPVQIAELIGRKTAQVMNESGNRAVYLASTDLSHYGPNYGFTPAGVGAEAMQWAKDNDRRLLDKIVALQSEKIVPEVWEHQNACGAGAVAAMLAACREAGAVRAEVLQHASSYEVIGGQSPTNCVGYASVVVG